MLKERCMKSTLRFLTLAVLLLSAVSAYAVDVFVDVGGYPGQWRIHSYSGWLSGNNTVNIPVDTSVHFEAGSHPTLSRGDVLAISVDSTGLVTSDNLTIAAGGINSLTFNTREITIDPADYIGRYWVANRWDTGAVTFNMLVGMHERIKFVPYNPGKDGEIHFKVDSDGTVTSLRSAATVVSPGHIQFVTTPITINPAAYSGMYLPEEVDGHDWETGIQTFTYVKDIKYRTRFSWGVSSGLDYKVNADGSITSLSPVTATGSGATLTFNTLPITFVAGIYQGTYYVDLMNNIWVTGDQTVSLPIGVSWRLRVSGPSYVDFHIEADGTIESLSPYSATGGAQSLTLITGPLNIDTAGYMGQYNVDTLVPASQAWVTGNKSYQAILGVTYRLRLGGQTLTTFSTSNTGFVSTNTPAALTSGQGFVTFKTTPVFFDVGDYAGQWVFDRSLVFTGSREEVLVRGTTWGFSVVGGGSWLLFDVDENGQVISPLDEIATGEGNSLILNNESISVEPGQETHSWSIAFVQAKTPEPMVVSLIPGFRYQLAGWISSGYEGSGFFSVTSPCAVDPNTLDFGTSDFTLSCGQIDSDDDGVPDVTDNCPAVANSDQLDQDSDGTGNVCDDDLDGDTIANNTDNCPQIANMDQLDFDYDGLGNACDDDADGDDVTDSEDNCPFLPNTAQADNDSDGAGDLCDSDDDNDFIEDTEDNCPLVANTDQTDFDMDGEGDLCDGDTDNDTIANADDLCPGTPAIVPVTDFGCSGSQYIALSCIKDNFLKHGKYVSCVAHAAKEAVNFGLISPKEKSRFVSQAAKNK